MSTGRLVARWLALDPARRHAPARPRPEVPRQGTWEEGRWHDFFETLPAPDAPALRGTGRLGGAVTPSTV